MCRSGSHGTFVHITVVSKSSSRTYLDNPSSPGGIASLHRVNFCQESMQIDAKRYLRHSSVSRLEATERDRRARSSERR